MTKSRTEIFEFKNNIEIISKNVEECYNTNALYNNFYNQLNGWIKSLECILNSTNNRSILIYQTMVVIEILIKTRIIKIFKIVNYNDRRDDIDFRIASGDNCFSLNQMKHNIKIVLERLLEENSNISKLDKAYFLIIKDFCERIFMDINTVDINHYPDLRYNHNKDNIILVDNDVSDELRNLIKEVIDYARL